MPLPLLQGGPAWPRQGIGITNYHTLRMRIEVTGCCDLGARAVNWKVGFTNADFCFPPESKSGSRARRRPRFFCHQTANRDHKLAATSNTQGDRKPAAGADFMLLLPMGITSPPQAPTHYQKTSGGPKPAAGADYFPPKKAGRKPAAGADFSTKQPMGTTSPPQRR